MSTRWEREAAKGNEAAVKYKENLGKVPEVKVDWGKLERQALRSAINSVIPHPGGHFFMELERQRRERKKAEAKEAGTYDPMSVDAFHRGLQRIIGTPFHIDTGTPRTWGEWEEKLEVHDQYNFAAAEDPFDKERHKAIAARRRDWDTYLQESTRALPVNTRTKVLGRDPGWGEVVSRDHRSAQPEPDYAGVNGPSLAACAPENAAEAKSLFDSLLQKQPETDTVHPVVCACGRIAKDERDICRPVRNLKVARGSTYLKLEGGPGLPDSFYLSKENKKLAQDRWNEENPHEPYSGLDFTATLVYGGMLPTTKTTEYE